MRIGVDIEEFERFKKIAASPAKLKRIFSEEEIAYCQSKKNPAAHFAARFAAKEAVWKALEGHHVLADSKLNGKTLAGKKITITDINIQNTASGKPEVYINGKKAKNIDVSLSHSKNYVVAAAICA
ncbi:MAG: 4'-phosphopantetheinyl transferase superfamily protein [Elusimicrobia bacterium]|nr:4'-phosphopantetheinyl transferase superfamily protein [Elusimicrobiota bacterium]